jgi:hypothetical protein
MAYIEDTFFKFVIGAYESDEYSSRFLLFFYLEGGHSYYLFSLWADVLSVAAHS